jgi:hypothetical protein
MMMHGLTNPKSLARLQQVRYKNGKKMSGEKSEDDSVTTMQMAYKKSEK